jgi:hypothetical protein
MTQVSMLNRPSHSFDSAPHPMRHDAPGPRRGAILLVEDRDDVRQGLAQLLELQGFLVADARECSQDDSADSTCARASCRIRSSKRCRRLW